MNTRTILDISILQTVPPSNLNRDDTGSPKSAIYGGVPRARVSSQAWKRPTRERFRTLLDSESLGIRTKRVVEVLAARILERSPQVDEDAAAELAAEIFKAGGLKLTPPRARKNGAADEAPKTLDETGYLLFLGSRQYDRLAELAVTALQADDPKAAATAEKKAIKTILKEDNAVDVGLFGRMVADTTDLNIDAASQVAHAISVHRVDAEADYFTAVDDVKQGSDDAADAGAAMIGTVEFNSATLYRYANVDADRLRENLGNIDATAKAVEAFVTAFVTSIPSGKINTFAHDTLPDLVVLSIRDTQPVNLVGAFESPVTGPDRVKDAADRLVTREQQIDEAYDTTPIATWVVRIGEATAAADQLAPATSLKAAAAAARSLVEQRLADSETSN
ncbi:type I-E CRISPR-associated protein Cas7/Cse4/CasC [Pseudoclavibacter sp. CFCC 13611]|uniref:type I-E CRISPR-associated protein Cas7/Cse4/CasC n=1 Tax=Pseudoclavibacter sp. CFCC 13611 TaxID=2615178 RepID=UPI00130152FF|nr:type I-E CRISPR-associated protein Cas7/Cse4/CasC [Pseudoclavibacter sp. CFCC 13611]KAB1662977.1 type I-E CRISPR-associated protein Cas7/Cse4/CasC [Pseudoclavibacter sp. CFCC 13611]